MNKWLYLKNKTVNMSENKVTLCKNYLFQNGLVKMSLFLGVMSHLIIVVGLCLPKPLVLYAAVYDEGKQRHEGS